MTSHTLDLIYTQFGAQLLQAKIAGNDVLYNSSSNNIESNLPFRGGIQILFPQFGNVGILKKY
mgnify:CR=1 FL=1